MPFFYARYGYTEQAAVPAERVSFARKQRIATDLNTHYGSAFTVESLEWAVGMGYVTWLQLDDDARRLAHATWPLSTSE